MRNIFRNIVLVTLLLNFGVDCIAQKICLKCVDCEIESSEESDVGLDEDFTFNLGGENGSGIEINESDFLGAEEGEPETGAEIGAEIGTETGAEIGAATTEAETEVALEIADVLLESASEIPGVDVVAAIAFVAVGIYQLVEYIETRQEEIYREEQEERNRYVKSMTRSGSYGIPIFPKFHISVEDLNSKTNVLSYQIFIKSHLNASHLKSNMNKFGLNKEIGRTYEAIDYQHSALRAFSKYKGVIDAYRAPEPGADPSTRHHPKTSLFNYQYYHNVSEVDLSLKSGVGATNIVNARVKSLWTRTREKGYYESTDGKKVTHSDIDSSVIREKTSELRVVLVEKTDSGFTELEELPYTPEQINDHISIRIKDFKITDSPENLWILIKAEAHESFIPGDVKGKKIPWSDRLPIEYQGDKFPVSEYELAFFKVVDYVAGNTNVISASASNSSSVSNDKDKKRPFPLVDTVGSLELGNKSIPAADYGKSNLIIKVPLDTEFTTPKYIEFIGTDHVMVVSLDTQNTFSNGSSRFSVHAHYNNAKEKNKQLEAFVINTNSENDFAVDSYIPNGKNTKAKLMINNTPFPSGSVIHMNVHYDDYSMTRRVFALNKVEEGAHLPRAYYKIKREHDFLTKNDSLDEESSVSFSSTSDDSWLIEYLEFGAYVIMHKKSKKSLGVKNGHIGLFDYKHDDIDFYWDMALNNDGTEAQFVNVGSVAFLNLEVGRTNPTINYKKSTTLSLVKAEKVSSIIPEQADVRLFKSPGYKKVLSIDGNQLPALTPVDYSDIDQLLIFKYLGCLRYCIMSEEEQKYLHLYNGNLTWENDNLTSWLLTRSQNGNFNLSTNYLDADNNSINVALHSLNNSDIDVKDYGGLNVSELSVDYQFYLYYAPFPKINFPVSDHLIAYYPLDADPYDYSGNKNHGMAVGARFVQSSRGSVAKFDGVNDYINTRSDFRPKNGEFTVSFWMRTFSQSGNLSIVDGSVFSISLNLNDNSLVLTNKSPDGNHLLQTNLSDGDWHHIVLTMQPNEKGDLNNKLFLDEALALSFDLPSTHKVAGVSDGLEMVLGKKIIKEPINNYYKGYLDDVMVWDKVMNISDIPLMSLEETKQLGNDVEPFCLSKFYIEYRLDENPDDSGSSERQGFFVGNPINSYDRNDKRNGAMIFDGKVDAIYSNVWWGDISFNHRYTVSGWFKTYDITKEQFIVGNGRTARGNKSTGIECYIENGLLKCSGPNVDSFSVSTPVLENEWTLFHLVKNKNGHHLYINGVLMDQDLKGLSADNTGNPDLTIGARRVGIVGVAAFENYFYGKLDNIRITACGTSQEQIKNLYDAPFDNCEHVFNYKFDGGRSETLSDSSVYSNTLSGSAGYTVPDRLDKDNRQKRAMNFTSANSLSIDEMKGCDLMREDYTISAWLKFKKINTTNQFVFGNRYDKYGVDKNGLAWKIKNGYLYVFSSIEGGFSLDAEFSKLNIEVGTWNNYVLVKEKKAHKLYINGNLVDVDNNGLPASNNPFWSIGKVSLNSNAPENTDIGLFQGNLDDFSMTRCALSLEEIKSNLNSANSEARTQLDRELKFSDNDEKTKFKIFPNPSDGNFTLVFNSLKSQNITCQMVDVFGKKVYSEKKRVDKGTVRWAINASYLKNGLYVLEVDNGGWRKNIKIIVD